MSNGEYNMKQKIKALGFCSALAVSSAQAEIVFNGFANIVGGQTTSSDETLYGYDDKFNVKNGSLFALQATSDLGDGLGVTAQIISRGNNEWEPEFEWAYVSYEVTDELKFLLGRQRIPTYMYSDFLDVSYAYPWITPPENLYSVPIDKIDGVGAIYSTSVGEFDSTVQFIYGSNSDDLGDLSAEFNDVMGLSVTVSRGWLTLRAGYFQADIVAGFGNDALSKSWAGAGYSDVASNLTAEDDRGKFSELGFQVDYENILLIGEYTKLTVDNTALADENNYYVLAGYRFDNILIHTTYGSKDGEQDNFIFGVPVTPELLPLITPTKAIIDDVQKETKYVTVGLRWDFHDSASLKFEYTHFSDHLNSAGDAGLFRTAIVTVF